MRPVDRTTKGLKLHLLTVAELLQTIGGVVVPPDPERPASETEIMYEALYMDLEITRWTCTAEAAAPEANSMSLSGETNAEVAYAADLAEPQRTKMVLARCLQHNGAFVAGETLQSVWNLTLPVLTLRAQHFFPAPPAAAAGAAAAPGPARGGRGRGARGGRRGGRG